MSDPFIGQIIQGGWNFAPRGYASCSGQQIQIAQNSALFSLLGTTFGGDGQTTFNLPDLRGRSMINAGQGPGLSSYVLGQSGGTENQTLVTGNLPAHSHPVTNDPNGGLNAANSKASSAQPTPGAIFGRGVDDVGTSVPEIYLPAGTTPTIALGLNVAGSIQVGLTGNSVPFSILSPYLAVTVVIAMEGIFPSRP
jgi:microcystin-dependent protein